ncbi:hypothetical protein G7Y89_g7300 [Cudoniella acicularis]|uniref:Protein kinase domain-containing protein n=1 Tax=Cudoniella acicularis TaxID=354080 RepID=A0A8H4W277_9HELO|nr:hypothetical protein G7Y89_g7300 [Cudoniella acicularis]
MPGGRRNIPHTRQAIRPVQERFSAYTGSRNDFPWEAIQGVLQEKWPWWAEWNESRMDDQWVFAVPEKLSDGSKTYHSTLESYKDRLEAIGASLCLENEKDIDLPIRDLYTCKIFYLREGSKIHNHPSRERLGAVEVSKCNIHTPKKLDQWLGAEINSKEDDAFKYVTAVAKDPICRFIYIYAEHSRDRLRVTRGMLAQILTYHQVMPAYLDFMFVFGSQSDPRDLRFSSFRQQTILEDPPRLVAIPELGRSGRQFQLCYNLKGVTMKSKNAKNEKLSEWSIRQAAIHHQFDVVYGTTLWIVTKGRLDLQQRFKRLTGRDGRAEDMSFGNVCECFRSSLAAHLMYCYWSTEDWRWYICWLEEVIDAESSMAVYGPRGPGHNHQQYNPYHIQELHHWKEKACEMAVILEANTNVITALGNFYVGLKANKDFPSVLRENCEGDIDSFVSTLGEMVEGLKMHIIRAKLLVEIISDRKELVMQHLQGQAAERTEQLNLNLEKEAIVMRIVTIVTLLYLPATTDIIKYQNPNGGDPGPGMFSSTAMIRWLQVTLPLTVVTLFAAWFTYKYAERRKGDNEIFISTKASTPKKKNNVRRRFRSWTGNSSPTGTIIPESAGFRLPGTLLMDDNGHLIYEFQKARVTDQELGNARYARGNLQNVLLQSKKGINPESVEKIIAAFEKDRWAFCPVKLKFDMEEDFDNNHILPFCQRQKVNDKGGTASVFQAIIQEKYVCDEIKKKLGNPFEFLEYGKCYELAIKSYLKQKRTYEGEVGAFRGLVGQPDMVQYFGCYEHYDGQDQPTYNIILEFGEMDLVEYFHAKPPPQLPVEIVEFWDWISNIVRSIQTVHELSHGTEKYDGWHGDVKPDNILVVNDKLKLADFGFAEFKKRIEGELGPGELPTTRMRGGTDTYGAPELAQAKSKRNAVTQRIDVWSFGCVLSYTATWVVLGLRGIDEFSMLRRDFLKKQNPKTISDAFHNGNEVLPVIKYWHQHLKSAKRDCDTVTPHILDLVDYELLQRDPINRLSAQALGERLRDIIQKADETLDRSEEISEISEMHKSVKKALLGEKISGETTSSDGNESGRTKPISRRSVRISRLEGTPLMDDFPPNTLTRSSLTRNSSNRSNKSENFSASTSYSKRIPKKSLGSHGFNTTTENGVEYNPPFSGNPGKGKEPALVPPKVEVSTHDDEGNGRLPNPFQDEGSTTSQTPYLHPSEASKPTRSRTSRSPSLPPFPPVSNSSSSSTSRNVPRLPNSSSSGISPNIQRLLNSSSSGTSPNIPPISNLNSSGTSAIITRLPNSSSSSPPNIPTQITQPPHPTPPSHQPPSIPLTIPATTPATSSQSLSPVTRQITEPQKIWSTTRDNTEMALDLCRSILNEVPSAANFTDADKCTPIMIAAQNNNMPIVHALLPHSTIQTRDGEGKTILHHMVIFESLTAAASNAGPYSFHNTILRVVIAAREKGVDILNMMDYNRNPPLYYCVEKNTVETARLLICQGATQHPPGGNDVFIEAVAEKNEDMVALFLGQLDVRFEIDALPKTSQRFATENDYS